METREHIMSPENGLPQALRLHVIIESTFEHTAGTYVNALEPPISADAYYTKKHSFT